jgi:4-aminobutyrate aminotransferase
VEAALDRGLVLLACGLYGNVLRILAPLTISNEEAAEGLDLLEAALVDAGAAAT